MHDLLLVQLFDVEYYRDLEMWSEVTQDHWNCSKACVQFPIHFSYGAMLYRLRDIASYWSKIAKCLYPTCNVYLAPPQGVTP